MIGSRRGLAIAAVPVFLALVGLGTWQLQRLAWKERLIATLETRLASAPADYAAIDKTALAADPDAFAFRPVVLSGRYEPGRRMILLNRVLDGRAGVHLVVPLRSGGARVLVDLGWVANAEAAGAVPVAETPVRVTGILRTFPRPGWFTPANAPDAGQWYFMERRTMGSDAPVYVSSLPATAPPGAPIARPPLVNLRNDHLEYAITWYALAVALVVIVALVRRRGEEQGKARS